MSDPLRWVFVGGGNMASSLIGGLLNSDHPASHIGVVDIDAATRERVAARFGITVSATLDAQPTAGGYVLAVKPDTVKAACLALSAHLDNHPAAGNTLPLVVSVAAGIPTRAMHAWLPTGTSVVRCMPNTPALLGLGATGLYASDECTADQRATVTALLSTAGSAHWVSSEDLLDAVTALSGSGPAYFFYLIEQMIDAGVTLGLDPDTARQLAIDTAHGAASMARNGDTDPATLRRNVTSKGGTTAAALAEFDRCGFADSVRSAMTAARDRARELGDEFTDH